MAIRSLSKSVTRLTNLPSTTTTISRLTILRNQSTKPDFTHLKPKTKEEVEKLVVLKLEEAIHRMIVKKSQPDWLPLVPGGSFWVPPKSKSRGFAKVVANLVKDSSINDREILRGGDNKLLDSNLGWPSSAHFFKGASNSPLEGEMAPKHPNQYEEEEG